MTKKHKAILKIAGLVFLVLAIVAGVVLVKLNQDIREGAANCEKWGCYRDKMCCGKVQYVSKFICPSGIKCIGGQCTTDSDCNRNQVCVGGYCLRGRK